MLKLAPLLLAALIALVSCSDEIVDTSDEGKTIRPAVGSYYTFENVEVDSITNLPIDSTRDTTKITVLQSGISYSGRSNVVEYSSDSSWMFRILNYETNGDVSMPLMLSPTETRWVTLPIASKTTFSANLYETTVVNPGFVVNIKADMKVEYVGTEVITIKGEALTTIKLKFSSIMTYTSVGLSKEEINSADLYFSPKLGYIVKMDGPPVRLVLAPSAGNGGTSILIDYSMK